ncbi:Scr1 family TA system antitoxin-like transcriptional regulator [Saccharopolyspora hordei]|uniref:Scr1 family TA system antitoxin-like transcriptional regulator n=1 Tax=Saccharopolyspora hordei TaxID=1838 RepID=UPI00336F5A9B
MPSAELPTVTAQVIPFSTGAVPALGAPFILLSYAEDPDVAHAGCSTGCRCSEGPAGVETHSLTSSALRAKALGQRESITFLDRLARESWARRGSTSCPPPTSPTRTGARAAAATAVETRASGWRAFRERPG